MKLKALLIVISISFISNLAEASSVERITCGLDGSIEERIKSCSFIKFSSKKNFVLVTRTIEAKDIFLDKKTNLLWSDRLAVSMPYGYAESVCHEGPQELAEIEASWRLPTNYEAQVAWSNGINEYFSNSDFWFWTSKVYQMSPVAGWLFNFNMGHHATLNRNYNRYVRCVAD